MKLVHLVLLPILAVQTAVDVFLSVPLTSGGLHGQPVRGGAELGGRPAPSRPEPLVQPLLQPGCAAGREPKVARLWPLHIHGEGCYLIRNQWDGSGWGIFSFFSFFLWLLLNSHQPDCSYKIKLIIKWWTDLSDSCCCWGQTYQM